MELEEKLILNYLTGFLNGSRTTKKKDYQRSLMAKRRQEGKTQKASREYINRNKLAFSIYIDLIRIEPKLVRKDNHSFGRGVLSTDV